MAEKVGAAPKRSEDELKAEGLKDEGVPETEDVVVMASLNKDGEPDQSKGFKFHNDKAGKKLLELQKKSQQEGVDLVIAERELKRDARKNEDVG